MVSTSDNLAFLSRRRECRIVTAFSRTSLAAVLVTIAVARAFATEQPPVYSRFGFCSPPLPPACVNSSDPAEMGSSACRADAEAYVASVFKYRGCLAAEMERAVREANTVIDALRCAGDRKQCEASGAASERKP